MVRRVKFLILALVFSVGLFAKEPSEHVRLADAVTARAISQIEKEFNVYCSMEGGSMPHNVAGINVGFQAKRRTSIEEARQIVVRATEILLKEINADEKVRPFLAEYPFPVDRLHVSMSFHNPTVFCQDGTIVKSSCIRGNIHYSKDDPINTPLTTLYKESYEEALKVVKVSTLSNVDLCTHKEAPYETPFDDFLKQAVPEACRKWKLCADKVGGDIYDNVKELGFTFITNRKVSVEEARRLELEIIDFFMNKINNDPALKSYIVNYPLTEERVRVHLMFGEDRSAISAFRDGKSLRDVLPKDGRLVYRRFPKQERKDVILIEPDVVSSETYSESRVNLLKKAK